MADLKTQQGITEELKKQKELLAQQKINSKEYEDALKRVNVLEQKKANLLKTQKGISDSEREAQAKTKTIQSQIQSAIDARIKKAKELKTLESSSSNLAKEAQENQAKLLAFIKTRVNKSGELTATSQEQLSVIESINMGQNDISGLQKQLDLSEAREETLFGANAKLREDEKLLQGVIKGEIERTRAQQLQKGLMEQADKATGGLASKAKGFKESITANPKLAALGVAGVLVGVLVKAATQFSKKIDEVGQTFGFITNQNKEFRNDLIDAGNEAMMVGKNLGDVLAVTSQLSSEFGVALTEADDLARTVLDTAVATGLSNDEATKLFGTFMQIGNLTAKQAEDLIEGTAQLAAQEGVAPTAVLQDLAGSAEEIAAFTKDSGENIAEAAIQARKLGLSLQTTAKIADNLLDFENSITNEIQASVMIGKQLNFQKARQLALDNDIAGAVKEVVSQLGSEEEFNNLNRLQRKALADSIGVSVAEMAKLVGQTDKLTLSGAMAGKNFDDLVGQDALSGLSSIINSLKMVGAAVLDEIGKPIAGLLKDFQENIMTPEGMKDLKNTLVSIVNSVIGIINGIGSIAGFFTDIEIAKIPTVSLPTAQTGISGFGGGEIMVGETGPERVSLPRGSSVMSAEQTRQSAAGSEINIKPLIEAQKATTMAISNLALTAGRGEIRVAMEPQMGGNL